MNSITHVEAALPRAPFEAAQEAAAAWRGRCLDLFARTEAAVTETLLVLAATPERGGSIKLPHLVGQRYDALLTATQAGGPFASEGRATAEAMMSFRQHDALRSYLSHGMFQVTLDHLGSWHMVARVLALRTGRESRDLFAADEGEVAKILTALKEDGNRLRSILGQLRRQLATS